MALTRRIGPLLAIFLVLAAALAPLRARTQQQYNNTDGYTCNGRHTNCSTYGLYRTFQANESLEKVAAYFFYVAPGEVANLSGLSMLDTKAPTLPQGQALYIPLSCGCQNGTSQMQSPRVINPGDTFWLLSTTIYGGFTTYQAMMIVNPGLDVFDLPIGTVTIQVPIFCACPTATQLADGTNLLLTYTVYPDETLDVISGYFGITTAQLSAANQLALDATLDENTTLLVPLKSLPPIASGLSPQSVYSPVPSLAPAPVPDPAPVRSQGTNIGTIAGTSVGAVAALLVLGFFTARYLKRTSTYKKRDKLNLVDPNLVLRMFTYKDLSKATRNFSKTELLGSGGFGAVSKGTLPSGALVAVKRMRMESKHGKESFQAEVTSLSHIRHRNLVHLKGWCQKEEQLLLVYDYMCHGSLDEWLFQFPKRNGEGSSPLKGYEALPLMLRHSVLSGVAAALSYLHEECPRRVLHRDIKSSNVLLDGDWNAYLGDFGLARVIDHHKMEKTTMMAGTFGYMAPEMPRTGKATKESDVYSFGVLMLEVMCGRRPLDMSAMEQGDGILADRVWRAHEAGDILQVADSGLGTFPPSDNGNLEPYGEFESGCESQEESLILATGNDMLDVDPSTINARDSAPEEKKIIASLLHLGLLCCNPRPEDRPSMRLVSHLLQSSEADVEMDMPPLSDFRPHADRYSRRGLSEVATPWSSRSSSSDLAKVPAAAQGSSQSTSTPPSSAVSSGEPANNMLTSFAAPDSSVFSGR